MIKSHYLQSLFKPTSIAVIGASERPHSVGAKVFRNLLEGGFLGKLYAVNPKHRKVQEQPCYPSIDKIPQSIDLAVITTPASTVPDIITQCGENGVHTVIVITSGFSEIGAAGKELEQQMLANAARFNIRIIGPNCLGVMQPHVKMNATFDNNFALAGNIAFISQSGALAAAILDWAADKDIGFSSMVSLGNSADINFGDILDYLAQDNSTKSILLYIEGIRDAQNFIRGLQAASRVKPVIVIKAGRQPQGSRAALSHTGALIGDDDVFDNVLRRAGAVRVMTIEELFSATEILSSNYRVKGNRLAIITNGGGAGVMAADQASELNVSLPALSDTIISKLDKVLPSQWSHQNPIDIIGDATPERYHATLNICSKEANIDAILTMLVPVAMSQPIKVAKQIIEDSKTSDKPILACWLGQKQVMSSWKLFEKNSIPCFDTPEKAVQAFSYLADYHHNQELLLQTPNDIPKLQKPNNNDPQKIIKKALAENRPVLTTIESKEILKSFSIPTTEPINTKSEEEAITAANKLGFPVVMKINSFDISHKTDVGGVQLNIMDDDSVRKSFAKIIANVKASNPTANILGITVEPMFNNANNRELMIGVIRDRVFGPVISFGLGGIFVEVIKDRALALPPLNNFLAEQLIANTRAAKLLGQFRDMPPVHQDMIINVLLRVSDMVCEIPAIKEMDINPLIINDKKIVAVDARIVVDEHYASAAPYSHIAFFPSHDS